MSEDYYTQYCREHTDADARAFLLDQCRKGDEAVATVETHLAISHGALRKLVDRIFDMDGMQVSDDCSFSSSEWLEPEFSEAKAALSSSPAAVLQLAEDARVGTLLRKLIEETRKGSESCGVSWAHVGLGALEQLTEQAKAGEEP